MNQICPILTNTVMECKANHCGQIATLHKASAGSDDFCNITLRKTVNCLKGEKIEESIDKQHVVDGNSTSQMNSIDSFDTYKYANINPSRCKSKYCLLSSPVPKPLVPKPPRPIPNPVQTSPKAQLVPRGLRLTLKSYGPPNPTPPHHPTHSF